VHSGIFRARQLSVFLFFLISLILLILRLFYLQGFRHSFFEKKADEQHTVSIEIAPKRGTVFDRNMRVLAVNLSTKSIFADAREIKNKTKTASSLSSILRLNNDFVMERLSKDKAFVWIKRKVSQQEALAVKGLKIDGIGTVEESKRFYPNKALACHILGTVDIDNAGLEGIELKYNKYLKGESGWLVSTQDARRKLVESYQGEYIPPKNGFNIVLTIDEVIQNIAERELYKAYEKYRAKGASIIVIDPRTGDVLALANFPNFDLNDYARRAVTSIRNRAINDFFEPGSVFKIVTASAALEENAVRLTDRFDCENGAWTVGKRTLHDHTPHGVMTFKEIIEKSSNIGTVKVASRFGAEKMYKFMRAFGFYDRTGLELPGEVVGMNRPISRWSKVSMLAIPMGQEVTATAMQLACAIAVIADNGYLVKPRIISRIVDDNGMVVKEMPRKVIRKVITPRTACLMRLVLKGAVESGTGKKARIEDYSAGGKTGTAQKVEPSGVYSHDRFVASFIGFAPVEKPVLAVAVCVDEPRGVYYGGDVAAPVFKNVVDESLKYLNAKGGLCV
jgi:cell division protein FtsI/penicillin-binding protein 2